MNRYVIVLSSIGIICRNIMDIVITYVNGLDPRWQADYANCIGNKTSVKRYRDWGTLPYLLRGIEECMPFVENISSRMLELLHKILLFFTKKATYFTYFHNKITIY